jgi:hypothetical protein
MNDLVANGLLLFSAFATIVVMVLIIVKERRKQKTVDTTKAKKHVKRKLDAESEGLCLD